MTFATLAKMPKFHGHYFNWYDTKTLQPLLPQYISTVDSGNLAGYLVTLRAGLLEIAERPQAIDASFLDGIEDVVRVRAEPTERNAAALESRIAFVRNEIIPLFSSS